jgi:hypothetical protein
MTRRNFLKTTGAGAVALAAPKPSLFAADEDKPLVSRSSAAVGTEKRTCFT